jgi:hypothetical protein
MVCDLLLQYIGGKFCTVMEEGVAESFPSYTTLPFPGPYAVSSFITLISLASNITITLPNPYKPMALIAATTGAISLTYHSVGSLAVSMVSSISSHFLITERNNRPSYGIYYCISLKIINWRHNFRLISYL